MHKGRMMMAAAGRGLLAPPGNYSDLVAAANPIGNWPLNELSGTVAADVSGNGNDGTYVNAPALGAAALINEGTAVRFNGTNEYVSDIIRRKLSSKSLVTTVQVWASALQDGFLLSNRRTSSALGDTYLRLIDNKPSIGINHLSSSPFVTFYKGNTGVRPGDQIVFVLDNVNEVYKIYVNGELDSTHVADWAFSGTDGNFQIVDIAHHHNHTFGDQWYKGAIDHVSMFDRELSALEISNMYQAGHIPLMEDDFSSDTTGDYTQHADTAASWSISGGELSVNGGWQSVFIRNGLSFVDGFVECDVDFADNGGLVLRFQDNLTYYLCAIRDDSNESGSPNNIQIYKRTGGATFTALGAANITLPRGSANIVQFQAQGDNISAYANGVRVLTVTDTSIQVAGGAGLRHGGNDPAREAYYQAFRWKAFA